MNISTKIIAHRWIDAPWKVSIDNRLSEAISRGADGIECDVRQTLDGIFIISHDAKPFGLNKPIEKLAWQEINKTLMANEENARLDSLLREILKTDLLINLEIKSPKLNLENLFSQIPEQIKPRLILSSFHPTVIKKVPKNKISQCWLIAFFFFLPKIIMRFCGASGIAPYYKFLSNHLIKTSQQKNWTVAPWTVNNDSDIKKVLKSGVNCLITDYPERVKTISKMTID
ncbi:MAG: glycerophosphodiester phosphodiesterase [Patescibacteria group bacterium]|jgi:glycerophosphoryl diester phosphodiesterase